MQLHCMTFSMTMWQLERKTQSNRKKNDNTQCNNSPRTGIMKSQNVNHCTKESFADASVTFCSHQDHYTTHFPYHNEARPRASQLLHLGSSRLAGHGSTSTLASGANCNNSPGAGIKLWSLGLKARTLTIAPKSHSRVRGQHSTHTSPTTDTQCTDILIPDSIQNRANVVSTSF